MPIFLIAPLAAVGLFLFKMVVAAGYLVTGQWAALPQDGAPGAAAVVVAQPTGEPGDVGTIGTMSLALADGRTFTGRMVFADSRVSERFDDIVDRRTRNPISGMVQPPRHRRRSASQPVAVVELADASGASFRCAFFADSNGADGLCTDDDGRWFDLARVETPPSAG